MTSLVLGRLTEFLCGHGAEIAGNLPNALGSYYRGIQKVIDHVKHVTDGDPRMSISHRPMKESFSRTAEGAQLLTSSRHGVFHICIESPVLALSYCTCLLGVGSVVLCLALLCLALCLHCSFAFTDSYHSG